MERIVVNTLGELVDRTTPEQPDAASGRLRASAVFRGVARDAGRLFTKLDRLGGLKPPHSKAHLEEHLLRNFLRYGSPFFKPSQENVWELMVVAEHHGLPTRLLDWTHSPMVAAHFATLRAESVTDRIVWRLDWAKVHERFGLRKVVFLIADLERELEQRGVASAWEFLQQELRDPFVCLFEPPAVTDRLAVQSGAFTICSTRARTLDQVLSEAGVGEALTQYVIPAARVDFIRDQLDLCTVDERRLFPGLDGIAAELQRYYSSSGPPCAADAPD